MPTFPQTVLDAEVALLLTAGGPWTDITTYALQRDGTSPPITITRGRANESSQCNPSSCQMQWNNRDGRFSRGRPNGQFYGSFGRNTPVRVSVPYNTTYLRMEDDATSFASCPDSASLQITGSVTGGIDVRIDCQLSTYMPSVLCSKWGATGRAWALALNGDGSLTFTWFDGTNVHQVSSSGQGLPVPLGRCMLQATLSTTSGMVQFITAPTMSSPSPVVLATIPGAGATSISAAAGQAVAVGDSATYDATFGTQGLQGRVYEFQLYNGIAGTLAADPQFFAQTAGATSFNDAESNTWTVHGTAELSARSYRFHGECSSLPQSQDSTGTDVWTPVTASGILRRLQQGNAPLLSPMRRAIEQQAHLIGYWPCEDSAGASNFVSGIPGGLPMVFGGVSPPSLGADSKSFPGSAALPTVGSSTWSATVPRVTGSTANVLWVPVNTPSSGQYFAWMTTNGTGAIVALQMLGGTGLQAIVFDRTGNTQLAQVTSPAITGIGAAMASAELTTSGGNVQLALYVMLPGGQATLAGTTTFAGTLGQVTGVIINPNNGNLGATTIGHVAVMSGNAGNLNSMSGPLAAWAGETAANRFARLCRENNVQPRIYGPPAISAPMGPQQIDTLSNILQSCEATDRGQTYEPRQCFGLGYRTLSSLVNQAQQHNGSPLQIAWTGTGNQLGDGSQMVGVIDDDQFTVNDMIVNRNGGGSYEYQLNDGTPMSVSLPPAGVGEYQQTLTVYAAADSQIPSIASWAVHIGSYPGERYPLIPLNLARTALTALFYAVLDADIGDYAQITGPPPYLTPNVIRQLIAQATEQIGGFHFTIGWNGVPEEPYETLVLNDTSYGRVDTDGSTLASPATIVATSLSVATTNAVTPLWTTAAGDCPFDINVAGERITVTAVTGSSSPQTFTVTRSVNGVVKPQSAGADVRMWFPPTLALI